MGRLSSWTVAAGVLALAVFVSEATAQTPFDPDARLRALEITLPAVGAPVANYLPAVTSGNLVFLAGHGPAMPWDPGTAGKVGRDLTVEQGYAVARKVGINMLATLRAEIGDLKRVRRIVKVLGMVNAVEGFGQQPEVVNGFSDLMVEVFGVERGKHARSAVGMASLPRGLAVEVEMIVEVDPRS